MTDIIENIISRLPEVKAPQSKFILTLLTTMCCFVGRATYRNLSRHCSYCEKTFSRWFARFFDHPEFNKELLKEHLEGSSEKIAALDASFLKKSGKKTENLGYFWNGSAQKAEKGLEVNCIAIVDLNMNTAFGLECRFTSDKGNKSRISQQVKQIKDNKNKLEELGIEYIATDAYYSKDTFTNTFKENGFHQIGKLRHDSALWFPFEGRTKGRGRPKKYGEKADVKGSLKRWNRLEDMEDGTEVYEAELLQKGAKKRLKVVVLRRFTKSGISQALLFSTDTQLSAKKISQYYAARFQIEFLFRDSKQHTGLGECQSPKAKAQHNHANSAVTALNLIKIENALQKKSKGEVVISIDSWKRRKSNEQLMNLIFDLLEIDRDDEKILNNYEMMSNFRCIAA